MNILILVKIYVIKAENENDQDIYIRRRANNK